MSKDLQAELRAQFIKTHREYEREHARLLAAGVPVWELAKHLHFDWQRFADLRCGARGKRTGQPCPLRSIYGNGRCKFHGGMSTGPRTACGKARAALNGHAAKRTP